MENDRGTTRWTIIFYFFVFGCVLIAFWSGYRLGRIVERSQWESVKTERQEIVIRNTTGGI
jgi:hypothetical protein